MGFRESIFVMFVTVSSELELYLAGELVLKKAGHIIKL